MTSSQLTNDPRSFVKILSRRIVAASGLIPYCWAGGTMLIKRDLILGRVINRYQRFLADVELGDGSIVTAHCTNTGTMKTCWVTGDEVLLEPAYNPLRKLKFTWLACKRGETWVGVDTGIPNKVVAEAARQDRLPGFSGLHAIRTEVKYGSERSRIPRLGSGGSTALSGSQEHHPEDRCCGLLSRRGDRAGQQTSARTPRHGAGGASSGHRVLCQPRRCNGL